MQSLFPIQRALISVFDKSHIVEFARSLVQHNIQLLSTTGTAQLLNDFNIPVVKISDFIQAPEIMNGRVKTLHYKIYSGILSSREKNESVMNECEIQHIDMVVIGLYPFSEVIRKSNQYSEEEIIEYIDIGGVSMIRAAAKNYKNVTVIIDNSDYQDVLHEMSSCKGALSLRTRFMLAQKAFKYVAKYDLVISDYFNNQLSSRHNIFTNYDYVHNDVNTLLNNKQSSCFPDSITLMDRKFIKKQDMCYGENPHQRARLYIENDISFISDQREKSVCTSQQLQGKSLSYNNVVDMDVALECVKMFTEPTCVIVKHSNPCAVASSDNIFDAYNKAYQSDPISSFGAIIALNRSVDKRTAQAIINQKFIEAIIAPNLHEGCLDILSMKKNMRVLICGMWISDQKKIGMDIDFKRINGGLLVQDKDFIEDIREMEVVTNRCPTEQEKKDALFCWKVAKFVKSNAIVCGKNYQTTGIGSGQANRVGATKIATIFYSVQQENQLNNIAGSVMASDAFFPFSDSIMVAAKMGIHCIIQPGGSIRDSQIIDAANQCNIAMIFTHIRHFRH